MFNGMHKFVSVEVPYVEVTSGGGPGILGLVTFEIDLKDIIDIESDLRFIWEVPEDIFPVIFIPREGLI